MNLQNIFILHVLMSSSSRGILLEFLCSELMAAKISISNKPQNAMHIKVEVSQFISLVLGLNPLVSTASSET